MNLVAFIPSYCKERLHTLPQQAAYRYISTDRSQLQDDNWQLVVMRVDNDSCLPAAGEQRSSLRFDFRFIVFFFFTVDFEFGFDKSIIIKNGIGNSAATFLRLGHDPHELAQEPAWGFVIRPNNLYIVQAQDFTIRPNCLLTLNP